MALFAHIETLEEKKDFLERQIAAETARQLPDFTQITNLKKQKLLLKQEITRLEQMRYHTQRETAS